MLYQCLEHIQSTCQQQVVVVVSPGACMHVHVCISVLAGFIPSLITTALKHSALRLCRSVGTTDGAVVRRGGNAACSLPHARLCRMDKVGSGLHHHHRPLTVPYKPCMQLEQPCCHREEGDARVATCTASVPCWAARAITCGEQLHACEAENDSERACHLVPSRCMVSCV